MKKLSLSAVYEWSFMMRILVLGMLCIIIFYMGYLWDISDLSTQYVNNQQKEQDLKKDLQVAINKETLLTKEIAGYAELPTMLIEWQKKLINYAELSKLMNEILKIGTTNHLQFVLFTPGNSVKKDIYMMIPLKLIVIGEYDQLASFMSEIANLPLLVSIGNFNISKEESSESTGAKPNENIGSGNLLRAELTFEVYYLANKNQNQNTIPI